MEGAVVTIQRYSVNQHSIQTLLTWIESGEIAIPEIQRPFVWNASKIRDFIDSLYFGYPVGYLIAWRNPSVRLKDGSSSMGKRILIDGHLTHCIPPGMEKATVGDYDDFPKERRLLMSRKIRDYYRLL